MRTAFADTAVELVDEDPRVAVVLAEISTERLEPARLRAPERVINVGIMEQSLIGVAAGFALEGFHPIAHSLSPFVSERPYEQLKDDFGYQGLGGTFVGCGGSYDYAAEGATHHAPADVALMLAIPRMEVLVPGHPAEVGPLMRATYADGLPDLHANERRRERPGVRDEAGFARGRAPGVGTDGARVRAVPVADARGMRWPRRDRRLRDLAATVRR